jgi:hypothetical protein
VQAERVEQTAEEVIELGSGLALLAAVTLRLLGLLDAVGGRTDGRSSAERTTLELPRSRGRVTARRGSRRGVRI